MRYTEETSTMYERFIPNELQKGSNRSHLVDLCMKWATEVSLHDILSEERYLGENGADEIERTIQLLQKTVSFDVPLLLKPIFDIKNADSIFLTCMQSGAVNEQIKTMIELGIPRETALYLYKVAFKGKQKGSDKKTLEQKIRDRLGNIIETLPYWVQVQLDFLI